MWEGEAPAEPCISDGKPVGLGGNHTLLDEPAVAPNSLIRQGSRCLTPATRPHFSFAPVGRRGSKPPRLNLALSVLICVHPWLNPLSSLHFFREFRVYPGLVFWICLTLRTPFTLRSYPPQPPRHVHSGSLRPSLIRVNLWLNSLNSLRTGILPNVSQRDRGRVVSRQHVAAGSPGRRNSSLIHE